MASQPATPKVPSVRLTEVEPDGGAPISSGFNGHVHCTCLADLVQLECLSGARTVFCVMSQGRQGYLFFDAGSVTHATLGDLLGEEAALEMLSWQNGSFVQSEVEWPRRIAMATPWQQLLMLAAQRSDESRRSDERRSDESRSSAELPTDTLKRVVGLPSLRSAPPKPAPPLPTRTGAQPVAAAVPTYPVVAISNASRESSPPSHIQEAVDVAGAVRLGANGEVLAARGQGHRLVALGAYVRRLCDLIGEDLGLGAMQQFEGSLATRRVALFVEAGGNCVAVETQAGQVLSSARGLFDDAGRPHG